MAFVVDCWPEAESRALLDLPAAELRVVLELAHELQVVPVDPVTLLPLTGETAPEAARRRRRAFGRRSGPPPGGRAVPAELVEILDRLRGDPAQQSLEVDP